MHFPPYLDPHFRESSPSQAFLTTASSFFQDSSNSINKTSNATVPQHPILPQLPSTQRPSTPKKKSQQWQTRRRTSRLLKVVSLALDPSFLIFADFDLEVQERRIRPLPKRKTNATSLPSFAFAGEQSLNPTRFTFAPPPLPSILRLPPPPPSFTLTAEEIDQVYSAAKEKAAQGSEQDPATTMDLAVMEKKAEPDADKEGDIGGDGGMMVKGEEDLEVMVAGSAPLPGDLAQVTEPVTTDGESAEVRELKMKIQALEQEKLEMAKEIEDLSQLVAETSLHTTTREIYVYPPSSPSISSQDEETGGAEPLSSVFARMAGMAPEERKKTLFESQKFTEGDLPEEGDAEFMANILLSQAEEFDARKVLESLPEPAVPLTRTAWRAENGLKRNAQPPAPAAQTDFNYMKLISFILLHVAVVLSLIYQYRGGSLKFPYGFSSNPFLKTSLDIFNPSSQPIVVNAPTCLTWSNGSSELNDMVTCFACDEPIPEPASRSTPESHRRQKVYKHDPVFPVPNSVWVGYQWTKAAWKESDLYDYLYCDSVFECE